MTRPLAVLLLLAASCAASDAHAIVLPRMRARAPVPASIQLVAATPPPPANAQGLAVAWGVCGFLSILASAIKRLAPIALQPLLQRDLSWLQWGFYGGSMTLFAYVEGYGAFQKKFSPLVVERAMTLKAGAAPMNVALAPFYSMGLMHATKKRKIVSWSVSLSVAMIVGVVKRLPCAQLEAKTRARVPRLARCVLTVPRLHALRSMAVHCGCWSMHRPGLGRSVHRRHLQPRPGRDASRR